MLNVRLAGDHLYGKLLFTWMSLVMSMMVSFVLSFFPARCLGWDLELNWVSFWGFSFLLFFYEESRSNVSDPKGAENIYYLHNKEIWRFLNKLKEIITSCLRGFIFSKEIFPRSRFYFFQYNRSMLSAGKFALRLHIVWRHVDCVSTTFRMQDVRLWGNAKMKITWI